MKTNETFETVSSRRLQERDDRARELVARGDVCIPREWSVRDVVDYIKQGGLIMVRSQSAPDGHSYAVTNKRCECASFQRNLYPDGRCKHLQGFRLAVMSMVNAEEERASRDPLADFVAGTPTPLFHDPSEWTWPSQEDFGPRVCMDPQPFSYGEC